MSVNRKIKNISEFNSLYKEKKDLPIRIRLIIDGILPGTTDYFELFPYLIKKYKELKVAKIIHETEEEEILYNKKYQKLVDNCKKIKNNHKEFGKLLGYTVQIDLHKMDYSKKLIAVHYIYKNNYFLGYWKNNNYNMKKELDLLEKMKSIEKDVELKISYDYP
jgi:hypothetical protein